MKRKISAITVLVIFLSCTAYAQMSNDYTEWIQKAQAFYDGKQYKQSADAFTKAFASNDGKGMLNDRYNAACSWARAGNSDSAFFMLMRIATVAKYTNISHLLIDPDLSSLHNDKRWNDLCNIVKQNKEAAEAGLDKGLVAILDTIMKDDQGGRMQLEEIDRKYGTHSQQKKDLWKTINEKDSIDLIKVKKILDRYGWIGPDLVGWEGNETIFLVIQHSDIKTQEKYLPMMREAVKNKKAQPASLALLEDRVLLGEGKKQIYGSQIGRDENGKYYVSDLEDPDNVDKRRSEVGLGPLATYVQHWDLKWDVETYKKQLPEIENRHKGQSQ